MAGTPEIVVKFLADTSQLSKGFKDAEGSAKSFGSTTKKMGKAAVLAGGAAGLGILVSGLKTGIDEFAEAAKVGAQTEAAIKSTGAAANVSADHVGKLAESLMKKSGMDDEAIQSGENLLLTFTNISNQAGKGNDIFDQTTRIMTDMSVALGQDATQSAMQLGKALNDPVKGMTALRRVGVSFTEQQVAQVKAMQASGDTMGAQKLILRELNKEFGGSAEAAGKTLPGQLNILKQSYSNLAGELVGTVAPALMAVTRFLQEHPALFKALIIVVFALAAAFTVLSFAMLALTVASSPFIVIILAVIAVVAVLAAAAYLVYSHWGGIVDFFAGIWDAIKAGVQAVLAWIGANWPLIVGILLGPLGLLVAEVIQHWDQIRAAIATAMETIRAAVVTAWDAIRGAVTTALTTIQAAVTTAWNAIKTAIVTVTDAIKTVIETSWSAIKTAVETAVNALKTVIEVAWAAIKAAVTTASTAIETAVNAAKAAFDAAKGAASALATFFTSVWASATGAAKAAADGVKGAVSALDAVFDAARGAASALAGVFDGALKTAAATAKSALGGIESVVNAIAGAFNSAANAVDALIEAIKRIPSHIDLPSIPHVNIPGLASGGIVRSPTVAMVGERGPEAVLPLSRLSRLLASAGSGASDSIVGDIARAIQVRVYIGERELTGIVRSEVVSENDRLAQTLIAGLT